MNKTETLILRTIRRHIKWAKSKIAKIPFFASTICILRSPNSRRCGGAVTPA